MEVTPFTIWLAAVVSLICTGTPGFYELFIGVLSTMDLCTKLAVTVTLESQTVPETNYSRIMRKH